MNEQLRGKGSASVDVHADAAKAMAGSVNRRYEAKTFTVPDNQTDHSLKDDEGLFSKVPVGHNLSIKFDADFFLKYKSDEDGDAIELLVSDGPWSSNFIEFEDLLITNPDGPVVMTVVYS